MTDPDYLPVTAAVIERDGRILIARRKHPFMGHGWEFPGGKLEENETLPEGLRREIAEELAVEIAVGAELGVYRHAYTHFKVVLHAFACTLVTGEPQPQVASELCWALPAELPDFPMGKIDRQIAHRLLADSQKSA